jgi:hypothetical protein
MVGYITSTPRITRYRGHYILLLSQLNIALHWKSSYLFVSVLKTAIEQKKRVPGFLRLFQSTLLRLQINRYNITTVLVMVTGSFGKMSRTRVLRIGQSTNAISHSLTCFTQPVSYSAEQVQTRRGALGLRVWLF